MEFLQNDSCWLTWLVGASKYVASDHPWNFLSYLFTWALNSYSPKRAADWTLKTFRLKVRGKMTSTKVGKMSCEMKLAELLLIKFTVLLIWPFPFQLPIPSLISCPSELAVPHNIKHMAPFSRDMSAATAQWFLLIFFIQNEQNPKGRTNKEGSVAQKIRLCLHV